MRHPPEGLHLVNFFLDERSRGFLAHSCGEVIHHPLDESLALQLGRSLGASGLLLGPRRLCRLRRCCRRVGDRGGERSSRRVVAGKFLCERGSGRVPLLAHDAQQPLVPAGVRDGLVF